MNVQDQISMEDFRKLRGLSFIWSQNDGITYGKYVTKLGKNLTWKTNGNDTITISGECWSIHGKYARFKVFTLKEFCQLPRPDMIIIDLFNSEALKDDLALLKVSGEI